MPTTVTASSSTSKRATAPTFADADVALVMLAHELRLHGYAFTAVTATTRARRLEALGPDACAISLRDIFGWNLPFSRAAFPSVAEHLDAAGLSIAVARVDDQGDDVDLVRSAISFSTIGPEIIAHGAAVFSANAVELAPDTLRFCRLLRQRVTAPAGRALVMGAGSGAAGLQIAAHASRLVLADTNPEALRLCRINAALAGVEVDVVESDSAASIDGSFDLIVVDAPAGDTTGLAAALRLVEEALKKLAPGGRLILTTCTPIVDGVDVFRAHVAPLLKGRAFDYEEVEADVDAADDTRAAEIERVAVVALDVTAPRLQAVADHCDDVDLDGDFL